MGRLLLHSLVSQSLPWISLSSYFFSSGQGRPPGEKKSLTLDELSSIRSKLATAHLELKDLSCEARLALEAGRVCFSCQKTRFTWFTWALHCKICHRAVCKGCSVKLRLPTSTWTEVKVSSLSTQLGMTDPDPPVSRGDNPFVRTGEQSLSFHISSNRFTIMGNFLFRLLQGEQIIDRNDSHTFNGLFSLQEM